MKFNRCIIYHFIITHFLKYFNSDLHADILQKMYSEVVGIKLDVKENNYIVTRLEYTINEVLIESYNNIVDVGTFISYNF